MSGSVGAFRQIVADMFAGVGLFARIVEHVIHELEGGSDVRAETPPALFNLGLAPARMPPRPRRGLEQLGRLEPDHPQVVVHLDVGIVAVEQLQHLALGDDV